ncbi:MAG: MarR family transcriptional regulator [Pseudomonadota bacterium]|nr:MarR family transcriptional regulator [Pseudomonadota bacterium]MEC8145822.1 MarR family transcriptional regulator [Pseudomonadota bacterium]
MSDNVSDVDVGLAEQSTASLEERHFFTTILTFRLSRLQANLNAQAADLLRRHGSVPLAHWRVLLILHDNLATTQKDIVERAEFDKGQVSRIVERLVNEGLLVSESDSEDKRVLNLHLTNAGREMMSRLIPVMRQRRSHLISPFSDEELATLFDFLDRLDSVSGKLDV